MTKADYQKANKIVLLTVVITLCFYALLFISIMHYSFASGQVYNKEGVVSEVNLTDRTTTFIDENGEMWAFKGVKNWTVGDKIVCTMNSKNTVSIYDDEIIGVNKKSF